MKAANDGGTAIDYDAARELVYGMPYEEWKKLHQTPATDAQKACDSAFSLCFPRRQYPSPLCILSQGWHIAPTIEAR